VLVMVIYCSGLGGPHALKTNGPAGDLSLCSCSIPSGFQLLCLSVIEPLAEHRPGHARVLGRDGHQRFAVASARFDLQRPFAQPVRFLLRRIEHRSRPQDQQRSQVRIAGLGDAPQVRRLSR
jgi:hypothetical protein